MEKPKIFFKNSFMAKYPVSSHEYSYDIGAGFVANITCSSANTVDNGNGTYTITEIPNVAIATGKFRVRVKSSPGNKASAWLYNTIAFTGAVSPATRELTLTASGAIASGDLPIVFNVDGEDLVNNKITWPYNTYFDASSIVVDGYTCAPSTLHVLMDANKTVDIVLTPVAGDANLIDGYTYLDLVNDLQVGGFEDSKKPTQTAPGSHRWAPLSGASYWLSNKLLSVGSMYACKLTAGDLFLLGSNAAPSNLFEERGLNYMGTGTLKVNDGGNLSANTTQQPAIGDFLRISVLTSSLQAHYSSDKINWTPITLPTNFVNPNGKYIAGVIYDGGFLSYPQYKL